MTGYKCVNAGGCSRFAEAGIPCSMLIGCRDAKPRQDDNTDKEMALSFLQAIDEAECSLQAWDLICNAIEALK